MLLFGVYKIWPSIIINHRQLSTDKMLSVLNLPKLSCTAPISPVVELYGILSVIAGDLWWISGGSLVTVCPHAFISTFHIEALTSLHVTLFSF